MNDERPYRYAIENRYQDSRWEPLGVAGADLDTTIALARRLARHAISFGMTRVVDLRSGEVLAEFSAGGREAS